MSTISLNLSLNGDNFLRGIQSVSSSVERLQANIAGFAAGFAGLAAAGAVVVSQFSQVKDVLDFGGELADLSANSGSAVQDLVILRQALGNAGAGAESAGPSIAKLQKALAGINEDGEATKGVFDQLGLSIHALRDMGVIEQFTTLQQAFQKLDGPIAQTKAAMDLFGKSGVSMLAFLTDSSALSTAAAQAGDLAQTMEANVSSFDSVSDAIGTIDIKFKQFYAGIAAATAGDLAGPLDDFSKLDFTDMGKGVGEFAVGVGKILSVVMQLTPLFAGLAAQLVVGKLVAGIPIAITAIKAFGTALKTQVLANLAAAKAAMMALGTSAGTGFAGMATSAKLAGKAIYTAIGGATGALTIAFAGLAYLKSQADKMQAGIQGIKGIERESFSAATADIATIRSVANDEEREAALQQLGEEAARVQERLEDVNEEYAHINQEDRDQISTQFRTWLTRIEANRRSLQNLTAETMLARKAERERAGEMARTAELLERMAKGYDELTAAFDQDVFNALPDLEKRASILRDIGSDTMETLDAELRWFDLQRQRRELNALEAKRALQLLDARKTLIGIERSITKERERQAEQAAEKAAEQARTSAEFEAKFGMDLAKTLAQAMGDLPALDLLNRIDRRQEIIRDATGAGVAQDRAQQMADAMLEVEDALRTRQQEEAAQGQRSSITADADRRVGLGGRAFSTKIDPSLKVAQETLSTQRIAARHLERLVSILEKPQPPPKRELPGAVFR